MTELRLIRHLVGQLVRGRRLFGLIALASVPGLLAALAVASEPIDDFAEIYDTVIAAVGGATLSIAVLVIGAAVLRDERDNGTLPLLYLSPMPRWRFALSSWAAGAVVAIVVATAGWIVSWVGLGIAGGGWTHAWGMLPTYLAAAVGYSAVALPLGFLVKRAIVVGLAYVFVWEGIIASLVTGLAPSSVWRAALSITADLRDLPPDAMDVLGPVAPSVAAGSLKVVGAAVLGTALLTWALRTRDAV